MPSDVGDDFIGCAECPRRAVHWGGTANDHKGARMRYKPSLDGLRAVAVIAVMAYHARIEAAHGGFLGVDIFFVLSGYLITRLLLEEHERTGNLRVGHFYMRRLRRLYPALLLMLGVYVLLAPWLFSQRQGHSRDALLAALYLSDYGFAFFKTPWFIQHTWSLAVEEHFYLLWPLALRLILRLPRAAWAPITLALALLAMAWRWYIVTDIDPWQQPYYRFDTRLSGLVMGAATALWNPTAPKYSALFGAVLVSYAMWNAFSRHPQSLMQWMLIVEIGAILLIIGAHQLRTLSVAPLVWIGRLSYGLYLWHFPAMFWLRYQHITGWTAFALGGALALAGATASYFTVERHARLARARTELCPPTLPRPGK